MIGKKEAVVLLPSNEAKRTKAYGVLEQNETLDEWNEGAMLQDEI